MSTKLYPSSFILHLISAGLQLKPFPPTSCSRKNKKCYYFQPYTGTNTNIVIMSTFPKTIFSTLIENLPTFFPPRLAAISASLAQNSAAYEHFFYAVIRHLPLATPIASSNYRRVPLFLSHLLFLQLLLPLSPLSTSSSFSSHPPLPHTLSTTRLTNIFSLP